MKRNKGTWLTIILIGIVVLCLLFTGYRGCQTLRVYLEMSQTAAAVKPYNPGIETASSGQPDPPKKLTGLQQKYPDFRFWLTVDGTKINDPVMQGKDNFYYLSRNLEGDPETAGSIYLDHRCQLDDPYLLLYGHHLTLGGMFSDIARFPENEYFKAHATASIFFPDGKVQRIAIFACVEADAYDPVYFTPGVADRATLLKKIRREALQYREIGVTASDRLIACSTCTNRSANGRVLVFGRIE